MEMAFPSLVSGECRGDLSAFLDEQVLSGEIADPATGQAFEGILRAGMFNRYLAAIYRSFLRSPRDVDPALDAESGLICSWGERSISFRRYAATPEMIYSSPYRGWIAVVAGEALSIAHHEVAEGGRMIAANPRISSLPEHCALFVDGSSEVHDYHVHRPVVGLRLFDHFSDHVVSVYDRSTLRRVSYVAGSGFDSEIVMAMRALAEGGVTAASDIMLSALNHPAHFVRWEAAKAIAALTPDKAPRLLDTLLGDPHPEVRDAAARSLERLQRSDPTQS